MRKALLVVALLAGCGSPFEVEVGGDGGDGGAGGVGIDPGQSTSASGKVALYGTGGAAPATCSDGTEKPCADGLACVVAEDCEGTCSAGLCRCGAPQFSLTISQIRTRGNDFVEIYNPTSTPITTDSTWSLEWAPLAFPIKYEILILGTHAIQPGGVLVVEGPVAPKCADVEITAGTDVPNSGSVRLRRDANTVDAVCFFSVPEEAETLADGAFSCEGTPVANAAIPGDGLARSPGGADGPCSDLGSSAADFHVASPSVPDCQ